MAEQAEQQEIVIIPAKRTDKGFLRRVSEFSKARRDNNIEELVRLTLKWHTVIVPDGVDPAEAIMDLSQDEFEEIMSVGKESAVDPQSAA